MPLDSKRKLRQDSLSDRLLHSSGSKELLWKPARTAGAGFALEPRPGRDLLPFHSAHLDRQGAQSNVG